jgi:DNA-binding protein H-NS
MPSRGMQQKKHAELGKRESREGAAILAAKYQGDNGETWRCHGLRPRWLSALVAEVKKKSFRSIVDVNLGS